MQIHVNRVSGYSAVDGSHPQSVVVYGIATGNTNFTVKLTWAGGTTGLVHAVREGGAWHAEFAAGTDFPANAIACSQQVWVEIPEFAFKTEELQRVRCSAEPTCPKIDDIPNGAVVIGDCSADSTRQVSITVHLGQVLSDFVDGHVEAWSVATGNSFREDLTWPPNEAAQTVTLSLPVGAYLAQAVLDTPFLCFGPTVGIEVPPCECPIPVFSTPTVTTLADGSSSVAGAAEVRVSPGTTVSARLVIVRNAEPFTDEVAQLAHAANQHNSFALSGTAVGLGAGSYRLAVVITQPASCSAAVSDPFEILAYYVAVPLVVQVVANYAFCPIVELAQPTVDPADGECVDGKRNVRAHADIRSVSGATDATLELRGSGGTVQLAQLTNQTSPFVLEGNIDAEPGEYVVAVTIDRPDGCRGDERKVTVAPCEPHNGGGGGGGGTPPHIPWCWVWFFGSLLMLLIGAALLGVAMCCANHATWIIATLVSITGGTASAIAVIVAVVLIVCAVIGIVLMFVGTVLMLICLMVCISCRGDGRPNCAFLSAVKTILTIVGIFWGALSVLLFVTVGQLCGLGFAIGALDIGMLLLFAEFYGYAAGCESWPAGWPSSLQYRIPPSRRIDCRQVL